MQYIRSNRLGPNESRPLLSIIFLARHHATDDGLRPAEEGADAVGVDLRGVNTKARVNIGLRNFADTPATVIQVWISWRMVAHNPLILLTKLKNQIRESSLSR